MRLPILGGGWFFGQALIEQARERNHNMVTFAGGESGNDVPGAVPHREDRASDRDMIDLAAMGSWDVVIDTSGMNPDLVERSARVLADEVDRYVYVSTVNVYQSWPTQPPDGFSPVRPYAQCGPPGESALTSMATRRPNASMPSRVCSATAPLFSGRMSSSARPSIEASPLVAAS